MRNVSVKPTKNLAKNKSIIKKVKASKVTQSSAKSTVIKLKLVPFKKSGVKKAKDPKENVRQKRKTKKRGKKNNKNMDADPLKSLYSLTGNKEQLVSESNKVPIYMAHTTIDPVTNSNILTAEYAGKQKKAALGVVQTPSPPVVAANIQRTEAKLAAALKSSSKKLSSTGRKSSGLKGLKKKKTAKGSAAATPLGAFQNSSIKKTKLTRLKKGGSKKVKTKTVILKSTSPRYATNTVMANRSAQRHAP